MILSEAQWSCTVIICGQMLYGLGFESHRWYNFFSILNYVCHIVVKRITFAISHLVMSACITLMIESKDKYVRLRGRPYIHTCRSYASPACWINRQAHGPHIWSSPHTNCTTAYIPFWASGGAKFPKMGDSMPWTLMNRCAKFDADSFILGGVIRNRTNTQTKNTNSKRYIHTLPIGMCG